MANMRKQNIFTNTIAVCKFGIFCILVGVQIPIIAILPRGRMAVWYMRVFMWFLVKLAGIKIRVNGKVSEHRQLIVVSNHISVFEIATFPLIVGGSFVAKKEMEHWPIVGPIARKFGVVFVDRRPSHARDALAHVQAQVKDVKYPMIIFPEGTTTNGAYVKPFKSTLFNFVENSDIWVQPIAMHYRYRDGTPIDDETLAEHYGYFDNAKQDMGPKCSRERSAFGQIFHIMAIGGFRVEITIMPPVQPGNMDRKEIASTLGKIVSDKYMELKNIKNKEMQK